MKNNIIILLSALFVTTSAGAMFERIGREMDAMYRRMDLVFEEMTEQTALRKVEAPDYDVHMREEQENVIVTLALSSTVKPEDISVEVEDGLLEVLIEGPDHIQLKIADQLLTVMVSRSLEQKEQDDQGNVHVVSSGSSHMSQSLYLPARVDVAKTPQASLDGGVLTLTIAKKGPQKIVVTSASEKALVAQEQQEETEMVSDTEDLENLK